MKKYGYIRVSTVKQLDGTSPEVQHAALVAVGVDPADIFKDDGVSGSVPWSERPEGAKLLAAVKKGDRIYATKLDRAFRSSSDFHVTATKLHKAGVGLVLLDISTEPVFGTVMGKLMMDIAVAFAEFERARIAARTAEGRAERLAKGFYVGGNKPFGYEITGEGRIEKTDWLDSVAARIRVLHDEGYSLRTIQKAIFQQYEQKISVETVRKIAMNGATVQEPSAEDFS